MRDLLGRRRGVEDDSDLLGALAIAAVLLVLPLATDERERARRPRRRPVGVILGRPRAARER